MKVIEQLANMLYENVLREYNNQGEFNKKAFSEILDGHISKYNSDVKKAIDDIINNNLSDTIRGSAVVKSVLPSKLELSKKLYNNSKNVAKETLEVLNQGAKANRPIKELSIKLYDGYGFRDKEVLDVTKRLPKYLQRELKKDSVSKDFLKYVDKIKTKNLKTALNQISTKLQKTNKIGLEKSLKVVLEEKSRYYATRIADTESFRARNLSRASEYMADDEIEFVKLEMSSSHKFTDICDYHAHLDVGYGAGVVKKEDMIALPFHPHCHCKYTPHYERVKKRHIKNPQKYTMDKFSRKEQQQIVGSASKLEAFKNGADIEELFNSIRPNYPIKKVATR